MEQELGRFLSNRLQEAAAALKKIEEKTLELQVALQTCEDEFVRSRLESNLKALAEGMSNVAAMARAHLNTKQDRHEGSN